MRYLRHENEIAGAHLPNRKTGKKPYAPAANPGVNLLISCHQTLATIPVCELDNPKRKGESQRDSNRAGGLEGLTQNQQKHNLNHFLGSTYEQNQKSELIQTLLIRRFFDRVAGFADAR